MKNLVLPLFLCFCIADEVICEEIRTEMIWSYNTKVADDFDVFHDFLRYKIAQSDTIAGAPRLQHELPEHPFIRHVYFSGKVAAYQECLNWANGNLEP